MAHNEKNLLEELTFAQKNDKHEKAEVTSVAEKNAGNKDQTPSRTQKYDADIVAAIDFGTTFSGYAYSFADNEEEIYINKNWDQGEGFSLYKTPTCLLLQQDGGLVSFGIEAVSMYNALSEEEAENYYYFDRFKMKLYNNKVRFKYVLYFDIFQLMWTMNM